MFKVNDYVVYATTGVCQVLDIKKEQFLNDEPRDYYSLSPIFSENTIVKLCVDQAADCLRNLHSKEEIARIIKEMPDRTPLWIDDERERSRIYRTLLKTGKCNDLITLINSIYCHKNNVTSTAKKYNKNDDDLMKRAENLLNEEFAFVLGMDPEEVTDYIQSQLPQ